MAINPSCSVPGADCSPPGGRMVRGYCNRHYLRAQRHNGDPLGGGVPRGCAIPEFIDYAVGYKGNECLVWPFGTVAKGYGSLRRDGEHWLAHRLVLTLTQGQAPSLEMEAAHKPWVCHNRLCVNPAHLRWATSAENSDDMLLDGTRERGEMRFNAILTAPDIHRIRHVDSHLSNYELGLALGVNPATIWSARNYKTWKHLP